MESDLPEELQIILTPYSRQPGTRTGNRLCFVERTLPAEPSYRDGLLLNHSSAELGWGSQLQCAVYVTMRLHF